MASGPEEKATMSIKLTMAFVAIIVALALPAHVARDVNRDNLVNRGNLRAYKSAQYCMPQDDDLPAMTRIYC
jgi:hypothetical protein